MTELSVGWDIGSKDESVIVIGKNRTLKKIMHFDASNPYGNNVIPADGRKMDVWVDLANKDSK